jgi:hypothetical protein
MKIRFTLALALIMTLILIPMTQTRAQEEENKTTFLQALANVNELDSYQLQQGIGGKGYFRNDELGESFSLNFRLSTNGNVFNNSILDKDQQSRVHLYAKLETMERGDLGFDSVTLNANLEIMIEAGTKLYVKLNEINISAEGMDEADKAMLDQAEMMSNFYKGEWYSLDLETLAAEDEEVMETQQLQEDFLKELSQNGSVKSAVDLLIDNQLSSLEEEGMLSESEKNDIVSGVEQFWDTRFFNKRTIVSGRNEGFTFFFLNKWKLIDFIKEMAGSNLTETEANEMDSIIRKMSLAGIYRINPEHDLLDNFLVKYSLRDLGVAKDFSLTYRQKISRFNDAIQFDFPQSATDFEEIMPTGLESAN